MKEMIPNGFNSKREASNNHKDYGAIDMIVMIPCGWNSQREVRNPGPVKGALANERMITG